MVSIMQIVAAAMGGLLLLVALIGFFRSFWRSPPKRARDEKSPDGMPAGAPGPDMADPGGHADGGGGHGGH
jgi:hypothetical protein